MSVPYLASNRTILSNPAYATGHGQAKSWFTFQRYIVLLVLHGIGGVLLHGPLKFLAPLYAVLILGAGFWWAYNRHFVKVAYVGAYIAGAEILWRMTGGNLIHEYGKYGIIFLFSFALLRSRSKGKWAVPLLYFAVLLPSAFVTFNAVEFSEARQGVSSVLSGPLALAVSVVFCSTLKITRRQLVELLTVGILPVFGIAVITLYATLTASGIHFTTASNRDTSAGFGANQVSSALGFGVIFGFFCMLFDKRGQKFKFLHFAVTGFMLVQAAMTFSRSGPYLAVGAILVGSVFLMRDMRSQVGILIGGAVFFMLANYVLLPQIDSFTDGAFEERVLEDRDDSGRTEIAQADVEMWLQNPMLGVGPGMSKEERAILWNESKSNRDHTEYSRLLAEHGVFGFAALLLLLYMGIVPFAKARTTQVRAFRMAVVAWAIAYMLVSSTRTAAPALLFGLAYLEIFWDAQAKPRFQQMRMRQQPVH